MVPPDHVPPLGSVSVPLPPSVPPLMECVPPAKARLPDAATLNVPLCVPPPVSESALLVLSCPLLLSVAAMVTLAPLLRVPGLSIVPEPATLPLTVSVPLFCRVRPSVTGAVTVKVAGLTVVPPPLIAPPDHVPPLLSVSVPLPPSVPPVIVNASAGPLASGVAVPAMTLSVPTVTGTPTAAVAPSNGTVPVPPIAPPPDIVCVPEEKALLPGAVAVNVPPLCVPLPASVNALLVAIWPLLLTVTPRVMLAAALSVPALSNVPEPATSPLTVSVPLFCRVRLLSVTGAEMPKVFVAGLIVVPLPLIAPPDHVPPFVSVSVPEPPSVPPVIVNAPAELLASSVAVPALTLSVPACSAPPPGTAAPLNDSVPVPPIEPPPDTECVPEEKAMLPGAVAVKVSP